MVPGNFHYYSYNRFKISPGHPTFRSLMNIQGFDWDGLAQGSLEAPYTPKIASATDLHNFDVFDDPEDEFLDCESPDDEGWDREF